MISVQRLHTQTMLASEHYPYYNAAMSNYELLEVHRSKISLHRAKAHYSTQLLGCLIGSQGLQGCLPASIKRFTTGRLRFSLLFRLITKPQKNCELHVF